MPKRTTKKNDKPVTTAQKLGSVVKSARDIMRTDNAQDWQILQKSIIGGEAKSLPLMLAHMSLLLHGFEYPDIDDGNSLRFTLSEMGEKDWVDVILTNPPFGGEEEDRIKNNFPPARQTKETALLFLQLIMRRLRQRPKPGRAAVVFPNGVLFGDNTCAKLKEDLLKDFNLHTIVRLPNGVFAPYTGIPTNLLFFDRSRQTDEIWYYELPLPSGRKTYTKTKPIQDEDFAECVAWWKNREENEHAYKYNFREVYNQAIKDATPHWDAGNKAEEKANQLAKTVKKLAEKIQGLQNSIEKLVGRTNLKNGKSIRATEQLSGIKCIRLSAIRDGQIDCTDSKPVPMSHEEAQQYLVKAEDVFIVRGNGSKHLVGQAGIVKKFAEGTIFPDLFILVPLDSHKILSSFFVAWWNNPLMREKITEVAKTTSGIWKINQGHIASFSIPVPPLSEQHRIVAYLD